MKVLESFKKNLKMLAVSIYSGDRLERNLKVISWIGFVIALVSGVMTGINIVQHKGFVTYTTAIACACGLLITASGLIFKKRKPAILAALFVCIFIFTYYTLLGVNDGFAILWTFLVPLAFSYFAGVIYGVAMSVYYEVLFVVLFYTPLREVMGEFYGKTFMDRFPMLYLCGVLLNCVAMVHYHVTTLAQIEYEKKLEDAAKEAISAGRAKSQFLAQMSHEIRTPINTILGMNEMILRESKDENVLDYSESIQESSRTLLSLINSILDFSKIEDGKMEILPVKYNTMSLIHNLVSSVSERAKTKELEFIVEVDEKLPRVLLGDDVRVGQVIVNLLTNAVKYTESGSVTLIMRVKERIDNQVCLFVCVKDTGIGIREEDHEKLFESFERLDEERNRNIEGTGLGMAIVIKLLAMMGSEIKLKSTYGKGSAFSFDLWQEIVDDAPMGPYSEKVQRSLEEEKPERYLYAPDAKVLVTDDNEMNLKVITHLMKRCGIKPDLASSGRETLEKVRQKKYDILLLDHMMPRMDGLETLQRLRKDNLLGENVTVIALTANAVVGAREKYLAAGFRDYLSKPINVTALEEALAKYLPEGTYSWHEKGEKPEPVKRPEPVKKPEEQEEIFEFLPEDGTMEFAPAPEEDEEKPVMDEKTGMLERLKDAGLDVQEGMTYCGNDEDFYLEVIRDYANGCGERKEELDGFLAEENWKQYAIKIHSLKSVSKTIGAMELFEGAKALEEASKREDGAFVKENHEKLMQRFEEMSSRLKGIERG